jgi:hypothetical protein
MQYCCSSHLLLLLPLRQGALDGGLDIPHSDKRFVGYEPENKALDSDVLREHIMGNHVSEYMEYLMEEDPEKYNTHFAAYIKAGLEPGDLEELYEKVRRVHALHVFELFVNHCSALCEHSSLFHS